MGTNIGQTYYRQHSNISFDLKMVKICSIPNSENRAKKGNKVPFYHLLADGERRKE